MPTRVLTTTQSNPATLSTVDGNAYPVAPMQEGQSGIPPLYSVVLRPGDTSGADNVFPTWAGLYAACSGIPGGVRVLVDGSNVGGVVTVPAGAYSVDSWEVVGAFNPAGDTVLEFQDGATITYETLFLLDITLQSASTAAVVQQSAGSLIFAQGTTFLGNATGSVAFFDANASGLDIFGIQVQFGDGTHPAFNVANGQLLNLEAFVGSTINAGAVAGAGAAAGTLYFYDTSTAPNVAQSLPGAMHSQNPANTAALLDAGEAGAASITVTGPAIERQQKGVVLVTATLCPIPSGACTISMQLERDSTPIGPVVKQFSITSAVGQLMTLTWQDTLPDGASHTYKAVISANNGQTVSTAADSGGIVATEVT